MERVALEILTHEDIHVHVASAHLYVYACTYTQGGENVHVYAHIHVHAQTHTHTHTLNITTHKTYIAAFHGCGNTSLKQKTLEHHPSRV